MVAAACSGSAESTTNEVGNAQGAEQSADQDIADEPEIEPTTAAQPTATPEPEPTATPEPTPTPNPDFDSDGVLNEDDDFPNDPTRSVALVSAFPLVDGVSQLDEDQPSVKALRAIQAIILAEETDQTQLEAIFDPFFFQSTPIAGFADQLDAIRAQANGSWEVLDVRAVSRWWLWVQVGDPTNERRTTHLVLLGVNPNTNTINEIQFTNWRPGLQTQQYPGDQSKSIEDVVEDLSTKTEFVGVLVADVTADGCTTIAGYNEDVPLATASIYKQWVLGAAATEIEAGRMDPAQTVTFTPGQFMTEGASATSQFNSSFDLTLQQAANLMMNLSDNGATDMVERGIGRAPARDFVATSGHTNPDILNPIIGVRDYLHLFSSVSPSQVSQYLNGTEEDQQAFIVDTLDPLGPAGLGIYGNQNAREYSWQASPIDICETLATLSNRFAPDSAAGQFINEAFSGEAFLFGVRNEWDRVWYKGGGIPGTAPSTSSVLTHATLVQSNDGRAHVIVIMFNADQGFSVDPLEFEAASLMSRIHELLVEGVQ